MTKIQKKIAKVTPYNEVVLRLLRDEDAGTLLWAAERPEVIAYAAEHGIKIKPAKDESKKAIKISGGMGNEPTIVKEPTKFPVMREGGIGPNPKLLNSSQLRTKKRKV